MKKILLCIISIIISLFIIPLIAFGLGYLYGLIIKLILGSVVVSGLSLFNLYIEPNDLPLFFGTINLIASFFWIPSFNKHEKAG